MAKPPAGHIQIHGHGPWLGALAALMAVSVHVTALPNPFAYDDHVAVVENGSIGSLLDLRLIVRHDIFRPLVNLSYAVDHAIWGLRPLGFHLSSVLLHVVNVVLLFHLTRAAVADWQARPPPAAASLPRPDGVAFGAAALFAVHPMMTEAVGYISGRAELLCGAFFLLGLLALRRQVVDERPRWRVAALVLLVLALASKESAVMLPLVWLAYDRLLLGGSPEIRRRRLLTLHLPLLVVVGLAGIARAAAFLWVESQPPPVPAWQYALMELGVVWRYLFLLAAPFSQSIVHTVREVTSLFDGPALVAAAGLVGVCILAVRARRRAPLVTLGAAWFLLLLVPSSSFIPLNQAMAEHRVYLASAGLFMAVAAGGGQLWGWLRGRGAIRSDTLPRAALAGLFLALSALTVARNLVWADPVVLWRDAVRKAPETWMPHHALGDALRAQGNCAAAIPAYEAARRLRPQEPLVYTNLGVCLMEVGRLDDAREVFARALLIDPGSIRVRNNLGVLALLVGRPDEGRRHFLEALARDPRNVPARQNLAALYETTLADPGEALRLCREIRAIAPHLGGVDECIRRNESRLTSGSRRPS